MPRDPQDSKLCLKVKIGFNKLVSYGFGNSEDPEKPADVKERLQKMELLEKKLKVQRNICLFGVLLTFSVYFLIWYFTECWALPFQKSPCKQTRDLPLISTNQSTLLGAVDEFTLALRTQVAKFRDTIEISHYADRQALSNATKNEIEHLFSQHFPDLIAFSAIKREDERLQEMEEAIAAGYYLSLPFLFISAFFLHIIRQGMADCKLPETKNITMSASENENSQNDRLKHLKRRIPLLYIATFTCIAIEVTLFLMFVAENYYGGSPTFSPGSKWNADDCSVADYEYKLKHNCTFTDYPNYGTKLEPILIRHIGKLDSFMPSPLEVRQTVWLYESDVIDAAIDNHLELKQFNVDRSTMPRKIGIVIPDTFCLLSSLTFFFFCFLFSFFWAAEEGSVWRAFKCFRIDPRV